MKKQYFAPETIVELAELESQILTASIIETVDDTDISGVDDFMQLSRENNVFNMFLDNFFE
ncbi:MAG: hypothetical protein IJ533_06520 [Prevotella sp.]|nr:hypothetical protein [Prevotella sp.]